MFTSRDRRAPSAEWSGEPSPLSTLDAAFRGLSVGPRPLAVDGSAFDGLPARAVPLVELRDLLLHPSCGPDTREAVWAELVGRAQTAGPEWVVGAAGVALPALRRIAGRVAGGFRGDTADFDSEVLAGFVAALRVADPDAGGYPGRLCWAAWRAGITARHVEDGYAARRSELVESVAPPDPWGHPDFLLATAVRGGLITAEEAELVGRTRLEGVPLARGAEEAGVSRDAVKMRRHRAEKRLVAAVESGELSRFGCYRTGLRPALVHAGTSRSAAGGEGRAAAPDTADTSVPDQQKGASPTARAPHRLRRLSTPRRATPGGRASEGEPR